jgi:hypothetical protein
MRSSIPDNNLTYQDPFWQSYGRDLPEVRERNNSNLVLAENPRDQISKKIKVEVEIEKSYRNLTIAILEQAALDIRDFDQMLANGAIDWLSDTGLHWLQVLEIPIPERLNDCKSFENFLRSQRSRQGQRLHGIFGYSGRK